MHCTDGRQQLDDATESNVAELLAHRTDAAARRNKIKKQCSVLLLIWFTFRTKLGSHRPTK